ncbi:hypothetical protein GQ53DRAFT_705965 [Thozetella sp. PMI_491]|nr:hypothetical protein GQ53DRAFT_705965 [Thozetella sp. PMI_491]
MRATLSPGSTRTFFTCFAQWPEAWGGRIDGNGSLVWNDCTWTGPSDTNDLIVSFAMDWKSRTVAAAHTYACSETARQGTNMVATGSVVVDLDCSGTTCFTKQDRYDFNTKQEPNPLAAGASCGDNGRRNQSWVVENYTRKYDKADTATTTTEKSISFTLRNQANHDSFDCAVSGAASPGKAEGSCKAAATSDSTAKFQFNSASSVLVVTQSWNCTEAAAKPLNAVGVAYVEDRCDRKGDSFDCASTSFWIGGQLA